MKVEKMEQKYGWIIWALSLLLLKFMVLNQVSRVCCPDVGSAEDWED